MIELRNQIPLAALKMWQSLLEDLFHSQEVKTVDYLLKTYKLEFSSQNMSWQLELKRSNKFKQINGTMVFYRVE